MDSHHQLGLLLATLLFLNAAVTPTWAIGVNYGMLGDNLPPPAQVAEFLKTKTIINRVRIFDANPDVLRAFANSGIAVSVTTPNGDIPALAQPGNAQQWVAAHVAPFAATIDRVLIGTEVLHWGPQNLIDNLVPAMRAMRTALDQAGFQRIQISTASSLSIMVPYSSWPASGGKFKPELERFLVPMLQFHRDTKSPFTVNPYPYFAAGPTNFRFCTFEEPKPWIDRNTKLAYFNMFDVQLDAVHSAMKAIGFSDVDIVVGETGWPSVAEPGQFWVNLQTAQAYNGGVIRHVMSGKGTPLMPRKRFEVYIFALFQENQKPGPIAEKNFGLFRPDFTPVYNAGVLRGVPGPLPLPGPKPMPRPGPKPMPRPGPKPVPRPKSMGKKWCVPKRTATQQQLQSALDYVCSQGLDCKPIQPNGPCFQPNTLRSHAAFAMNTWFQVKGPQQPFNCDFSGTGKIINRDPSYPGCRFA